ncbi:MAG: hypothetical protein LUQ38_06370 [Methanotrichaceae archaeon]|nr:hypothetical protein [Methanotrichaceae archaeon]MDD1757883.1 hypothetical protein [Methanotrichaceae archaeon]
MKFDEFAKIKTNADSGNIRRICSNRSAGAHCAHALEYSSLGGSELIVALGRPYAEVG